MIIYFRYDWLWKVVYMCMFYSKLIIYVKNLIFDICWYILIKFVSRSRFINVCIKLDVYVYCIFLNLIFLIIFYKEVGYFDMDIVKKVKIGDGV